MPCWGQTQIDMDFTAANAEELARAVIDAGYFFGHSNQWERGLAWAQGAVDTGVGSVAENVDVNKIKRAYARRIVDIAAKKMRWTVKATDDTHIELGRR